MLLDDAAGSSINFEKNVASVGSLAGHSSAVRHSNGSKTQQHRLSQNSAGSHARQSCFDDDLPPTAQELLSRQVVVLGAGEVLDEEEH